ncbi:MAG TPA: asparagine synthetase B family protein, partial [Rhodospirillum rubrum]|nr:asparagine synthetase B family protein [Rhodospirillum rubrum]HCF19019.1 asparagine synthetase B family protein [Rhodospirillum rubrum]
MNGFAGHVVFDRQDGGAGLCGFLPIREGRWRVALAGRLDDRHTSAAALDLPAGRDLADIDLAARAVERWGMDAAAHLLGDFALAAWFGDERRLMLAGDAMGMRTVYYWRGPDRVVFATGLRDLLAMPGVPRAIDEVFVADHLALNYGDDEATFYRDIRKVRPGARVLLSARGIDHHRFHRFDPERRIRLAKDGDYVDHARDLLDRAVADRMRQEKIAIMGSGGLDSACLAVAALRHAPSVPFLTAVPEPGVPTAPTAGHVDERPYVEALAAAFPGLRPEFLSPSPTTDWAPEHWSLTVAGAAPYRMAGNVLWLNEAARRAAALGATSYLTGAVGNLGLTWDGLRGLPCLFKRGRWLRLTRELLLTSRGHPRRLAGLTWRSLLQPLVGRRFDEGDLLAACGLTPATLRRFDMAERLRQRGNDPSFILSPDSRRFRIAALCRNRARRPDGMNSLRGFQGIDNSAPLADLRLVEFCLAIPEDQYLRDGTTRWLSRRLLRAAGVPAMVTDNRRRGYQHPEWFAHLSRARPSLAEQVDRLERSPTASRLIDVERLKRRIADWPETTAAAEAERVG